MLAKFLSGLKIAPDAGVPGPKDSVASGVPVGSELGGFPKLLWESRIRRLRNSENFRSWKVQSTPTPTVGCAGGGGGAMPKSGAVTGRKSHGRWLDHCLGFGLSCKSSESSGLRDVGGGVSSLLSLAVALNSQPSTLNPKALKP